MAKQPKKQKTQTMIRCIHPNAAGIDLGSRAHYVAVPEGRASECVRSFGCFNPDLCQMADWLKECGIETVVMESTGVYWIPVYQILERRGFEVLLVNAQHVKCVPGRKTDVQDAQWLQILHESGLLRGSFRPEDKICVVRSYVRQRENLVQESSACIQRMQKALDQMGLHLHKVISDISGQTGMRIIKAILDGQRSPAELAKLKDSRIRSNWDTIAKALTGDYRDEHLFCLRQELARYEFLQKQIEECEQIIEKQWVSLGQQAEDVPAATPAPPEKSKVKAKDRPMRLHLLQATGGVDLTAIDGLSVQLVQTIVSEIGFDMTRWPTEKAFVSWLKLCPYNKITGGKIKSSKVHRTINRATNAFRLAAWSLSHSKSALGGYYRRMKARLDAPQAITATAHKIAKIVYRMLRYGQQYVDEGLEHYEQRFKQRQIDSLVKRLRHFGVSIEQNCAVAGAVT